MDAPIAIGTQDAKASLSKKSGMPRISKKCDLKKAKNLDAEMQLNPLRLTTMEHHRNIINTQLTTCFDSRTMTVTGSYGSFSHFQLNTAKRTIDRLGIRNAKSISISVYRTAFNKYFWQTLPATKWTK